MAKERHWKWICQEARGQVISHDLYIILCIGLVCKELEKQFFSMKKSISTTMKRPAGKSVIIETVSDVYCKVTGY